MSYDLNLYVKKIDDTIIPKWQKQLEEFGIISEIHPTFTFNDHQGFLPFKVKLINQSFPIKDDLITGFELLISDITREEVENFVDDDIVVPDHLDDDCIDLFIAVRYLFRSVEKMDYYPDPIEFKIAWASAAILCELLNGVLSNPQVGGTYTAKNVKNQAKLEIENLDKSLKSSEWEIHKFDGWN